MIPRLSATYGDLQMNIEARIQDLSNEELERLLKCLDFALSGEAGEAEAFKLLAEIESLAIKENDTRNSGWIPDEQQAGYIA